MAPKRIVHIGTGPWGKNYLKTYDAFPVTIEVATRDTWRALIDARPDGVVICTPPNAHIELAQYALGRGIPVLIEKPLALSLAETERLLPYTAPILVDHLYLFSSGYQALKQKIIGKGIQHIETLGMGTKSHEGYSVLWDYGPHDISMILDLMGRLPDSVYAKEAPTSAGMVYEVELQFGEVVARSRFGVDTERARTVKVSYEDTEASFTDDGTEIPGPLYTAVNVFLAALDGTPDPRLGLAFPLRVTRVLAACERSIRLGAAVNLLET